VAAFFDDNEDLNKKSSILELDKCFVDDGDVAEQAWPAIVIARFVSAVGGIFWAKL
jgi:hypothetical protein